MGDLKEKCAVVGVSTGNSEVDAVNATFLALEVQEHRGDAASGIASLNSDGRFGCHSGLGSVSNVYTPELLGKLAGTAAIGHNRYPTSGGYEEHNQPVIDEALQLALGHNGNLSETGELERLLLRSNIDTRLLNDSEMLTHGIAKYMREGKDLPDAVEAIYPLLNGSFSCTAIQGDLVVAFRDPLGIRPFSVGTTEDGHMVTSETCGLYPLRAKYNGDVAPGEMVIMTKGDIERRRVAPANPKLDIFEIVYFCSPDSELYGESVGQMRYRLGEELAEQYPFEGDNYLVVPVPDSAKPIAEGYASTLKLDNREVIVKRRFRGGRSFQQPNQEMRQKYLDMKFTYIAGAAKGRDVIVVDDSIVRLNTARKIHELIIRAGARTATFLVGSPPIGFPDFSGIDTPDQSKLIAATRTPEQIRQELGCEFLGYLSLSRMVRSTGQPRAKFNLASFTGEYPYKIGGHAKDIKDPVSLDYLEES